MSIIANDVAPSTDAGVRRWTMARQIFTHLAILGCLVGLLEFVTRTGLVDELLFPAPSAIFDSFMRIYFVQGNIWPHLWVTMRQVIAGFIAGTTLGILLAIAAGMSEPLRRYMKPYVVILEATPRIAIGPLVIAWFGFGFEAKLVIVTLVCFFPPFVNTLTGMISTDEDRLQLMRSLGATKNQVFWKLMLPGMIPTVMAGVRLAMASALGGALVAEFISANEGMGVLMNRYTYALNMPSAFASLLTLSIAGFILYRIMEIIEAKIVFWSNDAEMQRTSKRRADAWRRA
jgi:NitT/TauT family transport system permease protein